MSALKNMLDIIRKHSQVAPVDIYGIIHEAGVKLDFLRLPANVSGYIKKFDATSYVIGLNSTHAVTRQRFTAAHELGHFIYHRDLLGEGTDDTIAYRAEGGVIANPKIEPKHERQANTFAANVLMPTGLIAALKAQGFGTVAERARALAVSEEALRIKEGLSTRLGLFPADEDDQDDDAA